MFKISDKTFTIISVIVIIVLIYPVFYFLTNSDDKSISIAVMCFLLQILLLLTVRLVKKFREK